MLLSRELRGRVDNVLSEQSSRRSISLRLGVEAESLADALFRNGELFAGN
jgi:hypothetical protein